MDVPPRCDNQIGNGFDRCKILIFRYKKNYKLWFLLGILNQNLLGTGDNANPGGHGTIVVPQVSAQFHQHFFTVRLDTEIDGNKNTVSVMDVKPDEADA